MKKLNQLTFIKIKKFLQNRGYNISKKNKIISENFTSLYYISLASVFLISFSYFLPIAISFYSKNFTGKQIVINSSNKNFNKVLEGNEIKSKIKESEKVDFKNLYFDVFDIDINENDTVRLSASTINQLFKDENYNLTDIRKNKLVKPISIDLLPNEIKLIENTKEKKELFIQIILPLILEENKKIRIERKTLFSILNKNNNTDAEKNWLKSKFKQYGVINRDLATLKIRMDEIPVSLAVAQAAKETGWGTSRFAQEGNALFGQWTYDGKGIKPAKSDDDDTHKVMKFKILKASVRAYQRNLNTHKSYREFRKVRAIQRDVFGTLNSLELVNYLDKYAETGNEYIKILKKIIEQNKLTDFDDAKILPSSIKEKGLI
jgi:Bax protein|tara:strand:- start:2672 stop:3799 length:1128 start_codon:yes stop_codon:yes gene_type:complete